VQRGEAAALHPEQQPEQHPPPPPRGEHLHGRVALRHGGLDVRRRHARRPRRGATLAAAAAGVVVGVVGRGGGGSGGGVLRGREEPGETLGAVAGGGGVVASLSLQRLQVVLQLLDEVDGASNNGRLVTLPCMSSESADQLLPLHKKKIIFVIVTAAYPRMDEQCLSQCPEA